MLPTAQLQQLSSSTLAALVQWGPRLLLPRNRGLGEMHEALRLDTQNPQLRAVTG